jgi:hypothetical protein
LASSELALHAFVEPRHTNDDTLVRAAADRLELVVSFDAKGDGAPFDA